RSSSEKLATRLMRALLGAGGRLFLASLDSWANVAGASHAYADIFRTYASGRFGAVGYPLGVPPGISFPPVVGGSAAHNGRKKRICGEGCTFPTPLCVRPTIATRSLYTILHVCYPPARERERHARIAQRE